MPKTNSNLIKVRWAADQALASLKEHHEFIKALADGKYAENLIIQMLAEYALLQLIINKIESDQLGPLPDI